MTTRDAQEDLQQQAELLRQQLLAQIRTRRVGQALSQTDVGERAGLTRMTVQRAEGGAASLDSFIALALAVGLTPALLTESDADSVAPHPHNMVHRGYSYNRLKRDKTWEDTKRETALAKHWEAANVPAAVGLGPALDNMVPSYTQDQASAVATAIQWLGSDVGFQFLTRALGAAGYDVVKKAR